MLTAHVVDEYNSRRPHLVMLDTVGRAKLRLQAPSEVVERACETAELLAAELRRRNWFVTLPAWEAIEKQTVELRKKQEDEEEAARTERAARREGKPR